MIELWFSPLLEWLGLGLVPFLLLVLIIILIFKD